MEKTFKRLDIRTAIGFLARRRENEQPECISIHEDCESNGNTAKNSSAQSIKLFLMHLKFVV